MITMCPACRTGFRVHAEQLALRSGLVRCGKCSRVFDAREHLLDENLPGAEARAAQTPSEGITQHDAFETAAPEPAHAETPEAEAAVAPGAEAFEFGPAADTGRLKRSRRWAWVSGSLLLLLLLAAQAAYYYRTAIVLLIPEAKPYAAALCANIGCDLPLPRRIELMSIEASDLQADTNNSNVMVLSATLKNRAAFEQQLPLLELTLTDAQDQPVVRRVLAAQDYLGKNAAAKTGFAANTEIAIKVFIEGSQVKATGYRLYLFYP